GTVRVGTGATWGRVAQTLEAHGLAITSGDTRDVGVGGLTLGGGMGWLIRAVGLTIDILEAVELVTVDGRVLTASAESEPDLFWALRGGGGNFGVVTLFVFRPAALEAVVGGTIQLSLDDLPGILSAWRDVMRAAPDELSTTFLALPAMGPGAEPSAQLLVCYAGDDEQAGRAAIAPLLELPGPRPVAGGHGPAARAHGRRPRCRRLRRRGDRRLCRGRHGLRRAGGGIRALPGRGVLTCRPGCHGVRHPRPRGHVVPRRDAAAGCG